MSVPHNKATAAGFIIALGIIFGDIGTSPLYVLNAIINGKVITDLLVTGSLSCIIWTLTIQTTIKYVILTLNADNKGEGGIFSLYALVRRKRKWLVFTAMIGGAAVIADGMITPPISVTAAVEGLRNVDMLAHLSNRAVVIIVLAIISALFILQQFGTASIGRLIGPVMAVWFTMIGVMGLIRLGGDLSIFKAFNPLYAIELLNNYPNGFLILGAVFLCTTGAEALYSDMGHCGRENIRVSWSFVKTCLLLNYLGQSAWLLANYKGKLITAGMINHGFNPFYGIMPGWFILPGIAVATAAAVIASQAIISGSFNLISEAIRLNLWPKMRIKYLGLERGQLYVRGMNLLLFVGCTSMVLHFQKSINMEAAYGLAITMCMIATTILFANFLVLRQTAPIFVYLYLAVYLTVELSFLAANMGKFYNGGYVSLVIGGLLFSVMYIWYRARKIKNRYVEFVTLEDYIEKLEDLSNDKSIIKHATHLVYMTSANDAQEIEHKIMHSILYRKPKRADIYWFVHVDTVDEPNTSEYSVTHIIPNDIIRVEFRLGFRVQPKINLMFRQVVKDLVNNKEVNITSRYESLERNNIIGDFEFIVMEKYLSNDNDLPFIERLIMRFHFWLKDLSLSEAGSFGLDASYVSVEKFALIVAPVSNVKLKRVFDASE